MIKFFILLVFFSCSHQEKKLPSGDAHIITRKFATVKEARNHLRNRWNYLFLLFEQSFDPYYGKPKWPLSCLEQNKQGKLIEEKGHLFFVSTFLLNEKKEPGQCHGTSTDLLFLHCQDSLNVYEIHCPPGKCASSQAEKYCSPGTH